ncbi:hypothetical protein ACQ4PT_003660 [Festuca glaucescens]
MKIKLAVDKSRNRVLFADVGSDFVNVILSFLTLPLSAVQFCRQGFSLEPDLVLSRDLSSSDDDDDELPNVHGSGCLSSLCRSVSHEEDEMLDVKAGCHSNLCNSVSRLKKSELLKAVACHGMLLMPFHSHEFKSVTRFFRNLKIRGRYIQDCSCWLVMARLMHAYEDGTSDNIFNREVDTFVRGKERFIISDDWTIKPASTTTMQDMMVQDFEEVQVCLGCKEVLVMFRAIFTDLFLSKENNDPAAPPTVKPSIHREPPHQPSEHSGSLPEICKIKLFFDREEKKVMYAECKHEFVNLILGFLTYPLGCLIKNIGTSHVGRGLDNLYRTAAYLDEAGFMEDMFPRECLLNPSLAPFNMGSYISKGAIRENEELYMCMVPYSFCGKGSATKKACGDCHCDLVEDRKYVVSDDLRVHQASAMRVSKFWCRRDKANVVEMDTIVGRQEAVELLQAVLTSETALTDVFIGRLEKPAAVASL